MLMRDMSVIIFARHPGLGFFRSQDATAGNFHCFHRLCKGAARYRRNHPVRPFTLVSALPCPAPQDSRRAKIHVDPLQLASGCTPRKKDC